MLKHCSRCGRRKPTTEFGKRSRAKDGLHPWCRTCAREYNRERYRKHADKIKEDVRAYRRRNAEAVRARDRARYQRNKEKHAAWWQQYYAEHREEILERQASYNYPRSQKRVYEARYRETHQTQRRTAGRHYYHSLPLEERRKKAIRSAHVRRARKRGSAVVPMTQEAIDQKMAYWGKQCWVCGAPMEAIDHVKPLSKGGPHVLANLRPICHSCNGRKANKWPLAAAMYVER
jgi:5-methylcytosine-specific restriction endonuclease McrA